MDCLSAEQPTGAVVESARFESLLWELVTSHFPDLTVLLGKLRRCNLPSQPNKHGSAACKAAGKVFPVPHCSFWTRPERSNLPDQQQSFGTLGPRSEAREPTLQSAGPWRRRAQFASDRDLAEVCDLAEIHDGPVLDSTKVWLDMKDSCVQKKEQDETITPGSFHSIHSAILDQYCNAPCP